MRRLSNKPWFAVKQVGYGVGLPIAWQGWLVSSLYVTAMVVSGLLMPALTFVVMASVLTGAFLFICNIRSDDDWRWRNGD